MDNALLHHSGIVQEVSRQHNFIQLKFLPAYSPQLNPIENVFSKIKNRFRSQILRPTNSVELVASIKTAFASVSQSMLEPFYDHSRGFLTEENKLQLFI
jgi:transposase